ncbi:MAG: type II/IV secretion system ATPase subunit [ANME-2 cluster archaeon]|nr:type II/IV secretion system ATPase subunit [ANME-2 cluster archaeon]MBC2701152.1 type II/IV secretion system ATPase subunit [ANME-2 cluster archaeon]MBC2707246.1 type II/IV secretion system ATPase subunit [ANME-2 cluster archaeon]MBC2746603.1 type II/IV secretion system ATPase subunit [ANME-2 cluster archaeon]MBC2763237.1 type II/IV secretion system ATPase subunit [ANME-2 cluster archaeon]
MSDNQSVINDAADIDKKNDSQEPESLESDESEQTNSVDGTSKINEKDETTETPVGKSHDSEEVPDETSGEEKTDDEEVDKGPKIRDLTEKIGESEKLLTDLIIPGGDKLDIETLRTRLGDSRVLEHRRVMLPESVESVWEKTLMEITQVEEEVVAKPEVEEEIIEKPKFIQRIINHFKPERIVLEDYDPEKHGALVELTLDDDYSLEEVELYPVNEPYSYVRISYNPGTHTYLYEVLEPEMEPGEKELFAEIKTRLTETLDVSLNELEENGAKKYLKDKVYDILWDYQIKIDTVSFTKILYHIYREFMGYGNIDPMMHDPYLEDVSCDGPYTPLYVYHRKYESIETNTTFDDENNLDAFVVRIAQICGRHISIADPLLDATMPDGSRIQLTLGREVTTRGSSFTIRKFKESPLTPPDLIDYHTYSTSTIAYLWLAAENNKNIIFAGGTASGKTSSMNAISLFIPPETKIVSIEDTRELNLPHPNWIAGVTRQTFTGGETGSIDMYDLLRAALRQRPEYMLVGEVRGAEAYVLFQAMSTGHTTFSTLHADSVQSVVHRLENPPINVPRIMLQALDMIIIQVQVRIGEQRVRRAKSITEIVGVDPRTGELLTNEVFTWLASKDEFTYSGRSYVLESVMHSRGWDDARIKEELKKRQEILEWARMKNVKHYEDVAKIVVTYYREPETLMEIVRKELYGS